MESNDKTLVLVTGANRSLGYLVTQQLAATGRYHVILACRDPAKALEAIAKLADDAGGRGGTWGAAGPPLSHVQLDSTSDASIAAAAEDVRARFGRLDALVVNAGIQGPQDGPVVKGKGEGEGEGERMTLREAFAMQFDTNVFGSEVVVKAFLPLLRASGNPDRRIVYTTSGLGSLGWGMDDASPYPISRHRAPIYRASKTALNMVAMCRAAELKDEGITVCVVDPGYCATDFNGKKGFRDPKEGAEAICSGLLKDKASVHAKYITTELEEGIVPW